MVWNKITREIICAAFWHYANVNAKLKWAWEKPVFSFFIFFFFSECFILRVLMAT